MKLVSILQKCGFVAYGYEMNVRDIFAVVTLHMHDLMEGSEALQETKFVRE